MSYQIVLSSSAEKDLKRLDRQSQRESLKALADIAENPYQVGQRLTGAMAEFWSYHYSIVGSQFRIAYEIRGEKLIIYVLQIGSRENFYQILRRRMN